MLRVIHTSDVQLGAPFGFLGSKGQEHRSRLCEAFSRIVEKAATTKCDLLLIAGDLFNSNHTHQDNITFVASQLARLRIPVCILPGNHDCYDSTSVYQRATFPRNVIIFKEQPTIWESPKLDVTVYGNAVQSKQSRRSPLSNLTRTRATRWHIAIAHGNLARPDIVDPPRPIQPDEIASSGMDYVALGDWHSFADYSQGQVKAFYSGAPEPTAVSQTGAGHIAYIELDRREVRVRSVCVGTTRTREIEVDVSGKSPAQITAAIQAIADPNLMLKVRLIGLAELGTVIDVESLGRALGPQFYHLEISNQSHAQLSSFSTSDFPENLIVGRFVRLMQNHIDQTADSHQRQLAEQALQVGVALLQGKKVL